MDYPQSACARQRVYGLFYELLQEPFVESSHAHAGHWLVGAAYMPSNRGRSSSYHIEIGGRFIGRLARFRAVRYPYRPPKKFVHFKILRRAMAGFQMRHCPVVIVPGSDWREHPDASCFGGFFVNCSVTFLADWFPQLLFQ